MLDSQFDTTHEALQHAVRDGAERTDRIVQTSAEVGKRVARAGADIVQRNAETVQHALQSGAEFAAQLTGRSAGHFGRVLGLSSEEAQKTALHSSDALDVVVRSTAALAEAAQSISREWASFTHDRLEQNFNQFEKLWRSRTPQDVVIVHSELLRDNLESVLHYAKRITETSVELGHDAGKQVSDLVQRAQERVRAA
ncbi:phasin family protein [Rhodoplanes roseus]|nr:phasin family protein [Rhodoplanes roseus]